MTAGLIPEGLDAITGGQLYTIRIKSEALLPAYLHWFLNRKSTQEFLLSHSRGSYVRTMAISLLRKLEITVPPLETHGLFI